MNVNVQYTPNHMVNSIFKFLKACLLVSLLLLALSCEKESSGPVDYNQLSNLPVDTGGVQVGYPLDEQLAPYGYYLYKPSTYERYSAEYPLLVFLHGAGEKGNSSEDSNVLKMVLRNGPPKLIEREKWSPTYPMIVLSPQCHDGSWRAEKIHELIALIVDQYKINVNRIYLTGLSMGGYGSWSYVQNYADTGYVAAIVPICGSGNSNKAESFRNMPVWAFHGDADNVVNARGSIKMVDAINSLEPEPMYRAKLTMYEGVGHNSWSRTYDGSGIGSGSDAYDPFEETIYDWFFQYSKE